MSRVKYNHSFGERQALLSDTSSSSSSDSSSHGGPSYDSRSDNVLFRTWNNSVHTMRGAQPPLCQGHRSARDRSPETTYATLPLDDAVSVDSPSLSSWDVDLRLDGSQYEPDLELQADNCEQCQDEEDQLQRELVAKVRQPELPAQIPATSNAKSSKVYEIIILVLLVCFLYWCVKVVEQEIECPHGTTGDEEVCGKGVHFCCIGSPEKAGSSSAGLAAVEFFVSKAYDGESFWAPRWTA